jgi:hypothetical protein
MQSEFGAPQSIAALQPLTRALRRQLLSWLAPLEALVRKLILIEAANFREAAPYASRKPPPRRAEPHVARAIAPEPEAWSACFHVPIPPEAAHTVPDHRAPRIRSLGPPLLVSQIWREQAAATPPQRPSPRRGEADPAVSALRLARRVEALRRALDDPKPHARRLARKLARLRPYARRERARRIACAEAPRVNPELERPLRDAAVMGCTVAGSFDSS